MNGACLPGHEHEGEPVTLSTGEVVGHVCRWCLVRLVYRSRDLLKDEYGRRLPPRETEHVAVWLPYTDDGRPLPILPNPGRTERR